MEQYENEIVLIGTLDGAPHYSHSNHGQRFFSFPLAVTRLSGAVDRLPILASEALLADSAVDEGNALRITGQIRSYHNRSGSGRRLVISVLAATIDVTDEPHENRVALLGTICRQPTYRRTPLGREICDVMLSVARPYRRTDILPCILWGRCAREAAAQPLGTPLHLIGRLQSRPYIKMLNDVPEERIAYEISTITADFPQDT